jgi:hypothetical protein
MNDGPAYKKHTKSYALNRLYHLAVMSDVISAYANTGCVTSGGLDGGVGGGWKCGSRYLHIQISNNNKNIAIRCSRKFRYADELLPNVIK